MDMLMRTELDLHDESWPIYARVPSLPPAFLGEGSKVHHSAVSRGCDISGEVFNSILSYGVTVGEGAKVEYAVVMPGVQIGAGAEVKYCILGEGVSVGAGAKVGAAPDGSEGWDLAVIGPNAVIAEGAVVTPGTMINTEGEEVQKK